MHACAISARYQAQAQPSRGMLLKAPGDTIHTTPLRLRPKTFTTIYYAHTQILRAAQTEPANGTSRVRRERECHLTYVLCSSTFQPAGSPRNPTHLGLPHQLAAAKPWSKVVHSRYSDNSVSSTRLPPPPWAQDPAKDEEMPAECKCTCTCAAATASVGPPDVTVYHTVLDP